MPNHKPEKIVQVGIVLSILYILIMLTAIFLDGVKPIYIFSILAGTYTLCSIWLNVFD